MRLDYLGGEAGTKPRKYPKSINCPRVGAVSSLANAKRGPKEAAWENWTSTKLAGKEFAPVGPFPTCYPATAGTLKPCLIFFNQGSNNGSESALGVRLSFRDSAWVKLLGEVWGEKGNLAALVFLKLILLSLVSPTDRILNYSFPRR